MPSIAIVTDTDASLPPDLAAKYGIMQAPINVHFGSETLRTGHDITEAELFERIDREGKLPSTSAPSPGQFAEAYQEAFAAGADAVVCLCVSSAISATYQAAVTACELMPDRRIVVHDTRSVSMAQGFMCIAAAEAAQAGASVDQVVAAARSAGDRAHVFGALATLKYLAMSGRVGHVAAGLGNLLNVKPVLTLRDGKLEMLERVRSRTRALERVVALAGEASSGRAISRMAVLHVNCPDAAGSFADQVRATLVCPHEIIIAEMSAGLSVHTGAGMLGIALVTD